MPQVEYIEELDNVSLITRVTFDTDEALLYYLQEAQPEKGEPEFGWPFAESYPLDVLLDKATAYNSHFNGEASTLFLDRFACLALQRAVRSKYKLKQGDAIYGLTIVKTTVSAHICLTAEDLL